MQELIKPTEQVISSYLQKFNDEPRFFLADQVIERLIEKFPNNDNIESIWLKTSVINDLYSTNIYGTFKLAQHILQLNIDDKINKGVPDVVNEIAIGHKLLKSDGTGDRQFYSFATKYCSWHNREAYPIYDGFVHKVLVAYQKSNPFSSFKNPDLKDFNKFKDVIIDFRNMYNLKMYGLKEIDKFLWIYGKDLYSPSLIEV